MCKEGFLEEEVLKEMSEGKRTFAWAKIRGGGGQENILFLVNGIAYEKAPKREKA